MVQEELQFSLVANELVTTKILLCPSDTRDPALSFTSIATANVGYCLGFDPDEQRPGNILATDRNLIGFQFPGLPDSINCFILSDPALAAKWRRDFCHGANLGQSALGDGSVQRYNDPQVTQTVTSSETDDGTLQFIFP
jgi:hypothetical protein